MAALAARAPVLAMLTSALMPSALACCLATSLCRLGLFSPQLFRHGGTSDARWLSQQQSGSLGVPVWRTSAAWVTWRAPASTSLACTLCAPCGSIPSPAPPPTCLALLPATTSHTFPASCLFHAHTHACRYATPLCLSLIPAYATALPAPRFATKPVVCGMPTCASCAPLRLTFGALLCHTHLATAYLVLRHYMPALLT